MSDDDRIERERIDRLLILLPLAGYPFATWRSVPARVGLPKNKRSLSLGSGTVASCPKPALHEVAGEWVGWVLHRAQAASAACYVSG
jgi:hypothetical protein